MATAYQHMKPFIRLRSFVYQRMNELKKVIEQAEDEITLIWEDSSVRVLTEKTDLSVNAFFGAQSADAQMRLVEARRQLSLWQQFYESMEACHNCNGYGETLEVIAQDESHYHKCTCCDGMGQERHTVKA